MSPTMFTPLFTALAGDADEPGLGRISVRWWAVGFAAFYEYMAVRQTETVEMDVAMVATLFVFVIGTSLFVALLRECRALFWLSLGMQSIIVMLTNLVMTSVIMQHLRADNAASHWTIVWTVLLLVGVEVFLLFGMSATWASLRYVKQKANEAEKADKDRCEGIVIKA